MSRPHPWSITTWSRDTEKFTLPKKLTVAEWVRQTLRDGYSQEPSGDRDKKLAVVRAAARYAFPAPDIEQMLNEIEGGYLGDVDES